MNLCSEIFYELDLPINTLKSHCMRIGPRFRANCSNIMVNGEPLSWVKKTKFLGVTILSCSNFMCDWHEARSNYYKTTNAILSNLGSNPPIDVVLKLTNSKCLPILMYGMAAVTISPKELARMSFAYNSVIWKLFGVKSKDDIAFVQYYCNCLEFSHLVNYNRFCFLNKLHCKGHLNSCLKIDEPDMNDLVNLSNMYKLQHSDSTFSVKNKIWNFVESSMFL